MGQVVLVSVAHLINDTYLGFIAALLPFLVPLWEISLAEAGGLVTAFLAFSYFVQPVFGWYGDRLGSRWLLAGGLLVGACLIGTLGLLPSFGWALPWVIAAGLGAAAFHPPGVGVAYRAGGRRRSFAISLFLMAGFLGVAVGPLEILSVVTTLGLSWGWLTVLPGAVISFLLFRYAWIEEHADHKESGPPPISELGRAWRSLSGLWAIVVFRNLTYGVFSSFLPLLLEGRGLSVWAGGMALSVFLGVGAVGGVFGGFLADRFDRKAIFIVTMGLAAVWLGFFLATRGPLSLVFLFLSGFFLMMSGPINLVMAQEMFPAHANLLASLMMGFAYGVGSSAIVAVGAAADHWGIPATLAWVVGIPVLAGLVAAFLPSQGITGVGPVRPSPMTARNPTAGLGQ